MTKYHINDEGIPGVCTASIRDCKFGGEAQHYESPEIAQKAYELSMASKTVQKPIRKTVEMATRTRKTESDDSKKIERYIHPQGKVAEVQPNGRVVVFKNGKVVSSSATAEKLRAGYGAWKLDTSNSGNSMTPEQPANKRLMSATSGPRLFPSPKVQEEPKVLIKLYKNLDSLERKATAALRKTREEVKENNSLYGFSENRAYINKLITDPKTGEHSFEKTYVSKRGSERVSFDNRPEDEKRLKEDYGVLQSIKSKKERLLNEIEDSGHGDKIPDSGKVLRVRNKAQKIMLQEHLFGQISDGKWENTAGWESWQNTEVIVDPKNLGRNFSTIKSNYQLNSKELLSLIGNDMTNSVAKKTDTNYDPKTMNEDLKDLRNIFKTNRATIKDEK